MFSSERFDLRLTAILDATHHENGDGTLDALELSVAHYSEEADDADDDGFVDILDGDKFKYLLSYLAGVHHDARERARRHTT